MKQSDTIKIDPSDESTYPTPYDMVKMVTSDGRTIYGWHAGNKVWKSLRLKPGDGIIAYTRKHGLY